MRLSTFAALTSVSIAALVLGAAPATAQVAQDEPAAPSGAAGDAPNPECLNLPEGDARDRCISGEVELESGQAIGDDEEIVVTGSRIRNPNVSSPVPITSVSAEELTDQGDVNVGDALNDLPSLRSTFSQANSTRFIGTAGVNLLDLRGLGTERTLVLVNGRRHVSFNPGTFQVDVNTIPTDLIERVDIVTGGSSAVYGSDAVAGVVNFILKRDFDGIRLRGQGGMSSRGDRGIQFITLTAGENLFDDRANVAINLEYVNAEPLYFRQRPGLTGAFDGRCQFNIAEPTAGEPPEGDGVPDNQFFCGVRNLTISTGGTAGARGVGVFAPTSSLFAFSCTNPNADPATVLSRCLNPGTPQGQPRIVAFNPDGTLCEVVPSLDFRPFGSGNFIQRPNDPCQGGTTLRETGQLAPGLDRYTANLLAHYEVSEALRPFVEAKFARVDALQEGQPSFFQGSFGGFFGAGRGVTCDNPFLTPQNIAVLQSVGRCLGGPTSTETIFLSRFNVDFGGRQQEIRRDTYRLVGGVTGEFNTDWSYEVSLNYGRSTSDTKARNNLVVNDIGPDGELLEGPFLRAVDAVRAPNGQIVCRVNADADPTNNDPNCVPVNLFGNQRPSQAALDFFNTTSLLEGRATQFDALAFVSGDVSQLLEFQGGAPSFVVGAEYRTEKAHEEADPLSAAGATFFNAFPEFDPPKLKVREFFGEIQLPLLRDAPWARELTLTGAARHSDYNTSADTTFAWNANATWAPIRDLRLRGNYSKSVRVPTLADLFQPSTQNFAFVSDPCDVLFIGGGPNRAANCAALGVPAGFVNTVARTQTIEIVSGGNPNLKEETGKGFTVGGVFTPSFVPGLSLSVDYYKIKVENIIETLSAQTILNQCVDLPSINNQFCALIFPRQPDGLFAQPALLSSGVNFARQDASGIDIDATYRRTFANGHRLLLRGIATRVLKRDNFISPTDPDFADRQLSELGDPKWAANATIGYGFGNFDMRYNLNYIGKQTIGAFENYFGVQDRDPVNEDFTEEVFYPDVLYHAIRFSLNVPEGGRDRMTFYFGADNIFDRDPPLGLLGTGGGDPFDSIGRYFYAGATIDF